MADSETRQEIERLRRDWARIGMRAYNESPDWRGLGIHQDDNERAKRIEARLKELGASAVE